MKTKNNYYNSNNNFLLKNKNNRKELEEYYTSKNNSLIQISLDNKKKKIKLKPPFKKGLYSFKQSFNTMQDNYNKKIMNNNIFSYYSPNYSHSKQIINNNYYNNTNRFINTNNIVNQFGSGNAFSKNNSSLSFSSINLNKYKINTIPVQNNKNLKFKNDTEVNRIKNTNMSLNLNPNNIENNNTNNLKAYQNNFKDNPPYEKESRRMIIEYIKILNKINNNSTKQALIDNNISLKVLNQKYAETENDYNSELFGEAKKQLYLKNLNYTLSNDTYFSNPNEDVSFSNNNILNINNINNNLLNKGKKKIDVLNFLCVPRILNLLGEDHFKEKYIFLITLDETYFKEGKESYFFQWRDMSTNEIENEFNLKEIKSCTVNKKYNNRFILEVEKEESGDVLIFEIETPSEELCDSYITGINYLL
jgi:hypothetical protein